MAKIISVPKCDDSNITEVTATLQLKGHVSEKHVSEFIIQLEKVVKKAEELFNKGKRPVVIVGERRR